MLEFLRMSQVADKYLTCPQITFDLSPDELTDVRR